MNRARIAFLAAGILGASLAIPASVGSAAPADRPWMNTALAPADRAALLVQAMTLDEKVGQIHMLDVPEHPREVAGVSRLGIPAFKITNGPAGAGPGDSQGKQPATALPAALAMAASWNTAAATKFGTIAGQEVADRGEHLIEAPGVNITRVPRNGRNFEYFGEDPYLAGQLSVAEVQAIQAQGILAEVKHYAANNQENQRKTINEIIDERTLREIYLPAFEATVKQGDVAAVMCAYPKVNGAFGCENTHLLSDVLRKDWGFQGFVQSDYTATHSTVAAALAGLDLSMKHDFYGDATKTAVQSGQLAESVVDQMLIRRYTQMFKLGLFDNPPQPKPIPAKADGAVARAIGEEGAVLLKNSASQLPLTASSLHSIAVIGPYASAAHTGGTGSSAVSPLYTVSPVAGITSQVGSNVTVTLNDGSNTTSAANAARNADVAIVMVGNKDKEGTDRTSLSLSGNQNSLVSAVAAANNHTVVVLKTGGPVLMPWLSQVEAVLEAWYPGEEDGTIVADLLFGKANPSGKLPMSFPRNEGDTPANTAATYPGVNGTVRYSEGLQVGYRWYDARNVTPLFPFGFGLSYTKFSFANLSVPATPDASGKVTVSVDVRNTGSRAGADVVQVYVAAPSSAGEPPRQLKGFAKVSLNPGETRRVSITLQDRAFSVWNGQWTTVPGKHTVLVGDSSRNLPLQGAITI
ncbi:MAG: glycosyl hydrolase [Actinobacteria bacterium 13_1_20CM_3_71_11]|nr:MAG: glycosyl hydrolase [Actinobacteria bacterium 13_1_20CM_3_71_11]